MIQPAKRFTRKRHSARVYARVTEELLDRVAMYGNFKQLTLSEAVRALVEIGLDHASCRKS